MRCEGGILTHSKITQFVFFFNDGSNATEVLYVGFGLHYHIHSAVAQTSDYQIPCCFSQATRKLNCRSSWRALASSLSLSLQLRVISEAFRFRRFQGSVVFHHPRRKNRRGPSIIPCETPEVTLTGFNLLSFTTRLGSFCNESLDPVVEFAFHANVLALVFWHCVIRFGTNITLILFISMFSAREKHFSIL